MVKNLSKGRRRNLLLDKDFTKDKNCKTQNNFSIPLLTQISDKWHSNSCGDRSDHGVLRRTDHNLCGGEQDREREAGSPREFWLLLSLLIIGILIILVLFITLIWSFFV